MENYKSNSFNYDYAIAWSLRQGEYSFNLAKNLIQYLNTNGIKLDSALDLCCGTGEFLSVMKKTGALCYGTEIAQSMLDFDKNKFDGMKFELVKNIYDIPFKNKFDLISCNHDMVNTIENFGNWDKLFKNVKKSLNKNGMFVFDYYSKAKLENWDETIYEQGDDIDYVKQVKPKLGKSVIVENYYIKKPSGEYEKTGDIQVESYYENNQIIDALKKAGFKTIYTLDSKFAPVKNLDTAKRVHIIAK